MALGIKNFAHDGRRYQKLCCCAWSVLYCCLVEGLDADCSGFGSTLVWLERRKEARKVWYGSTVGVASGC